jgi:hypothetical protein
MKGMKIAAHTFCVAAAVAALSVGIVALSGAIAMSLTGAIALTILGAFLTLGWLTKLAQLPCPSGPNSSLNEAEGAAGVNRATSYSD